MAYDDDDRIERGFSGDTIDHMHGFDDMEPEDEDLEEIKDDGAEEADATE